MLQSMTGFGTASRDCDDKTIHVEIRTLNSRNLDMRMKTPPDFREKEMEIRRFLSPDIRRGKVDLLLSVDSPEGEESYKLNEHLFRKYYDQLSSLSDELDIPKNNILSTILEIPNVVQAEASTLTEKEWETTKKVLKNAVEQLVDYRKREGREMKEDLREATTNIINLLSRVKEYEEERMEHVRNRLHRKLKSFSQNRNAIDEGRFEQEVLYYLEKIDINEEKVRLRTHCDHLIEVLDEDRNVKGRKLKFISQEMGREINTLGAKANSSDIQQLVVQMKEDLEKIKEQVANIV